ncbi:cyclophilin-like family protein [Salinigranum halophilum]|uniref:cyclophilin-like family protein n=1 Tax=Salinigranum halophilum TaxID=2565931 RepID=UPI0010A7C225|nr:cyclophilin-like family protein [Salinigranum halophilum]
MAALSITVTDEEVEITLDADWTDDAPETRAALAEALPVAGEAARWGDELYVSVPVATAAENARTVVDVGTVAYWPAGEKLCLFWGPTPASEGDEPRAAAPVNVVARVDDASALAAVEGGARVRVERA